jgi:hypothetical protein
MRYVYTRHISTQVYTFWSTNYDMNKWYCIHQYMCFQCMYVFIALENTLKYFCFTLSEQVQYFLMFKNFAVNSLLIPP